MNRNDREKTRRDIELILLGAALTKSARQDILDRLPRGSFTKDIEPLIESVRSNSATEMLDWLAQKGIVPAEGETIIACLMNEVDSDNKTKIVRDVCKTLGLAARLENVEELKARLSRALKTLEGI